MATSYIGATGHYSSHASLAVRLLGELMLGIKDVTTKVAAERTAVYGAAREPLGFTIGKVAYECSFTIYRDEWNRFKARAAALGYRPMDAKGTMTISTREPGAPSDYTEVDFVGLADQERASSDGSDAHEVKVTLTTLRVRENGVPLVERAI